MKRLTLILALLAAMSSSSVYAQGPVFSDDETGRAAYQQFQQWQANQFRFFATPRWTSTVTNGGGLIQGTPTTLTWSIATNGTAIPNGIGEGAGVSNLITRLDQVYHGGGTPGGADLTQRTWWGQMNQSFNRISALSGLSYIYQPTDDGATFFNTPGQANVRGDVRIGGKNIDGNSGVLAYNFSPDGGDMVIDTNDNFFNGNSLSFRNVVMHEHGHGIGQAHTDPVNNTKLMEPFINLGFDGPQFDDILGIQRQYGDVREKSGGNDVFGTATSLGNVAIGGSVQIGTSGVGLTSSLLNNTADTDFISIDDNSDTDFISFSVGVNAAVNLTLTPVGPTYLEGAQNGATSNLVTSSLSDLTLSLFAQNGTTLLATSNINGLGGIEQILGQQITAGTYFARITGVQDNIQMYHLSINAVAGVPEPGTLGILALAGLGLVSRRRRS